MYPLIHKVMPTSHGLTATVFSERHSRLIEAVKTIIECVGEDPDRKGLVDTPERYANAMLFFTRGYSQDLKTIVNGAIFGEDHDEMVVVKDIAFPSLCEHHLVPFIGKVRPLKSRLKKTLTWACRYTWATFLTAMSSVFLRSPGLLRCMLGDSRYRSD